MAIKRILVVDDSRTELMFMTDLLHKNGFAVRTAANAADAFRRLAQEAPDVILMEGVMPGQIGFQLTRAITRDPIYADVPVFMCTSKNQETDRVWGMHQGARHYLAKPLEATELLATIDPGLTVQATRPGAQRDASGCPGARLRWLQRESGIASERRMPQRGEPVFQDLTFLSVPALPTPLSDSTTRPGPDSLTAVSRSPRP